MQSVKPGRQLFTFSWPLKTHWREATCEEVSCPGFLLGFTTMLDESVQVHKDNADWIRYKSQMSFSEELGEEGLTTFTFPQGQDCWEGKAGKHRVKTGRPERLFHKTLGGVREFTGEGRAFNENMNEKVYAVERELEGRR